MNGRSCAVCGHLLRDRRSDAIYCGGPCRAEASRERAARRSDPLRLAQELLGMVSPRHRRTHSVERAQHEGDE